MNQLPADGAREQAAMAYVQAAVDQRPAHAARWAASINQPALRREAIQTVASSWLRTDRLAAVSWLRAIGARDLLPVPFH